MDASGVGLEAPEAGEHQDGEEEGQHGDAQGGVCDQGQRLQIPLQLLLKEREGREMNLYHFRGCRWRERAEERRGVVVERDVRKTLKMGRQGRHRD